MGDGLSWQTRFFSLCCRGLRLGRATPQVMSDRVSFGFRIDDEAEEGFEEIEL